MATDKALPRKLDALSETSLAVCEYANSSSTSDVSELET